MGKIIFFTSSYKIGLTGQLCEQALTFSRHYPEQFFFLSGEKEQFPGLFSKLEGGRVPHAIISGLDEHADFRRLVREFSKKTKEYLTEYVVAATNWQLAIAVAAKFFGGGRYSIVYIVNGYRNNYRFRSIVARFLIGVSLLVFADHVVTPSSFLAKKFWFLGSKKKTIFIGEDEAFFGDHPLPDFSAPKVLVFPGEFRIGKNQETVIRALKWYIDQSGDKDVLLYLPGKGVRLEECKALCRELGLEGQIVFSGFIDRSRMLDIYLKSQFAVVPSITETFGHCIVEPFLLGRVVLTRNVGVAEDIIRDGETGFLFNSEEHLGRLLLRVLPDRQLCETVARNAFEKRDMFRWENVCRQHFELIFDQKSVG